nr:hypothetical protein [Tanacetum cinerariifolium]
MTTLFETSTTDSQVPNNIMAAGSKDCPPMLATRRYAQWRSRFLRYIDTRPNGDALWKCILEVPEHTTVETLQNLSLENKAHYESEKEVIHLILTGIEDEIYSTVDACKTAQEIWEAIERLQQEWSRFMMIVKQQHKLDEVSYHKLFDILKQYQKEVNELRAKRIARNANPLALVVTAQSNQDPYYKTSKSHKPYAPTSKASILTRSHVTTRNKGKEIAKLITPPSESASKEDSDPEQAQRDKEFGHFAKEYRKPKRVKDSTYHKEKMLLYKQAKQGVPLQAEQSDWLADMHEEIDEQELKAHYSYMAKIQEDDSNVIPDSPDMCDNDIKNDQNVVECDDEHVALANLIANLKLDVDENKKIQKKLKKENASLTQELTKCKSILVETSRTLGSLIGFEIVA